MSAMHDKQDGGRVRSEFSDTPQTAERTYPANCLGKTLVVNAEWASELERENAALRELIGQMLPVLEEKAEDESDFWGPDDKHGIARDAQAMVSKVRAAIDIARKEDK